MPSPTSHLRAPLLWLLVPLIGGLVGARLWPAPAFGLMPLVLAAVATGTGAIFAAIRPGRLAGILWAAGVATSAGLGGFVMLHARHPMPPVEASRPPRETTITIAVKQPFATAPSARQFSGVAEVTATGAEDEELAGRLVYYSAIRRISVSPLRTGRYVIRGVLEPLQRGPGVDGFTDYLANLGVTHRLIRAHLIREVAPPTPFAVLCNRTQDRLENILRQGLADRPQAASLYLGMLLGEKAVLSADQQNAYMRSGTFHVFSISGLHVGVIATALIFLRKRLHVSQTWSVGPELLVLWVYVQVTGASSPAMRAYIMVAAFRISRAFRLPGNQLAALAVAAVATLLLDPLQLFSTGFQMSYTVVIALVTMGRPLSDKWMAAWKPFALLPRVNWRRHHRLIDWGGRHALGTLAGCWTAFLASTPSGIGYFQLFSPGSLPANLVVIPMSTGVIYAGFVSLLAGLVGLTPVSAACNLVAAQLMDVMDWVLQRGTALPATWFTTSYRADWLAPASLGLMTTLFLAGSAVRWSPRYGGFWPPAILLALLMTFGVKFG